MNHSSERHRSVRATSGVPGLDEVLHGGLIANRLYLLDGDPGSGKTTIALQFLLEGAHLGEHCLYITLSETKEELIDGAASHGWDLDGIEIVELVTPEDTLQGDSMVTMYPPSEVELTETTKRILDTVQRLNPNRVVFDSLSEMRLLAQSSLRYRRQILALKQFFIGRNCTVLLLDDRTSEGSDLQLQSIAHGVISLEQTSPLYGTARRRLNVIKLRGTNFISGYHDMIIQQAGVTVFPRLVAAEHSLDYRRERVSSGVPELDQLVGGGLERGMSTLLMGPAGSGKSTVAMQYAIAAAERGERATIFTFDESPRTLLARSVDLGIPLSQKLAQGLVHLRQIDPAELSPGEFISLVRISVEQDNARLVVIDSLNGYMHAMPEERFLVAQLHELLTYLGHKGVNTLMVVAQHGMLGSDMESPVDTSYLADTVVLLRFFEHGGKVRKAISVLKKRSGTHEESIREIYFNHDGIHLGDPLTSFHGILSGTPDERVTA